MKELPELKIPLAAPDIDEQIDYVKYLRKDVIKHKPLWTEMQMVQAIEQSLIALKLMAENIKS